ncbi:hypothetical protein LBBP_04090 [Leptospira borgpetersenii serovar Ballum]|uniref:Uncharacterized protein n=1 Tax=Leptospira borgpetersenii serovar Ballum TaxID=280505 RepID=A0A0S2IX15_LEPBO|nr:hypothetical protein LBBP_04090 [Leptospira borgpetersenii serovar Ballum]
MNSKIKNDSSGRKRIQKLIYTTSKRCENNLQLIMNPP